MRTEHNKKVNNIILLVFFIPDTAQVRFEIYSVETKRAKRNKIKYIAPFLIENPRIAINN